MASNVTYQDVVDEVVPDYELLPEIKVQEDEFDEKKVVDVGYRTRIYEDMYKTNGLLLATLKLIKRRRVKKARKKESKQKKIEKLQQWNEELKKSTEVMQRIIEGQYSIQEALERKARKLEFELHQERMKI